MTISIVLCLISKLFLGLDKLGIKGLDKNLNSCPSLNYRITFCPPHKLFKIQNFLFFKHYTNTKFVQHLKFYCIVFGLNFCLVEFQFRKTSFLFLHIHKKSFLFVLLDKLTRLFRPFHIVIFVFKKKIKTKNSWF
jgi:hypothetical protein